MNGVVHTKRIYPYAVGGLDNPGVKVWIDPENAMQPGGGVATRVIAAGAQTAPQQHWTFRAPIPTFAKIVGARWITRASVSGAPSVELRRYAFNWIYPGETSRSPAWTNIGPSNSHGPVMEEVSGSFSQLALDMFNGLPTSRPTPYIGMRHNFSASCQLRLPDPAENDVLVSVDYVAIEFDYTIPPTPWKCLFKLQPDHAIGEYGMKLLELKQGSTSENLLGVIRDATGAPLDLRGAEVTVTLKSKDHVASFLAEIVDAEAGEWRVPGTMGFAEVPGNYHVEVTLDWLDGTKTRLPSSGYEILKVWEALA